jgi:hypothetical protein
MILNVPTDIARFVILRQIAGSVFAAEPYSIDNFIYVDHKLSLDVKFKDEGVEILMFDEGLRGTIPVKSDSPSGLWSLTPDGLSADDLSEIASRVSTFTLTHYSYDSRYRTFLVHPWDNAFCVTHLTGLVS